MRELHGPEETGAAEAVIEREITCYAAKDHLKRGHSLLDPNRDVNSGYAPTFERITRYEGRVAAAAQWRDLLGTTAPDRPWIDGLPSPVRLRHGRRLQPKVGLRLSRERSHRAGDVRTRAPSPS
ncbi:MAG: hypothetical protein WD342_00670 [Verrucomicrobiales bacterium]